MFYETPAPIEPPATPPADVALEPPSRWEAPELDEESEAEEAGYGYGV